MTSTRHALVTGASRGIGRAVSAALAEAGMHVHVVARGGEALHALAAELSGASAYACDVTDAQAVAAMTAAVARATADTGGAPDVIVNTAGLFAIASLDETDPHLFEQTVQANLVGPFRILQAFLPAMRARGSGHIVTLGSVADRSILPGNGAYASSKFGQRALHETLRAETRGTGLRATLVSPAATDTSLWDAIDPDNRPGFPKRAEMLRAEDVAAAVRWAVTQPPHVNIDELRLSAS